MLISPEEGQLIAQRYNSQLRAGAERDILAEAVIRLSEFETLGVEPEDLYDTLLELYEASENDRLIIVPERDRLLGVTAQSIMRLAEFGAEKAMCSSDSQLRKAARAFSDAINGTLHSRQRRMVRCRRKSQEQPK